MKNESSMKKSLIVSVSVLVFVLIVLLAFNYYFSSLSDETNKPPKLPPTSGVYEGAIIDKEYGFFEFEGSDESRFIKPEFATFRPAKKGLNYYYPKIDLDVGRIINEGIKPAPGLKVLFAYYSSEPTKYNQEDCFIVFPMGPYTDTCPIPFNEIYDFVVPRNNGFIIIANQEFEYNYTILADSNTMASEFTLNAPTDEEGWILRPLAPDVDLYNPAIEAVWLQSGPDTFEAIADFKNIEVTRPYKMAWIKYKKDEGEAVEELAQDESATDEPATEDPDAE